MSVETQHTELYSKLLAFIATTFPYGDGCEEALDLKVIADSMSTANTSELDSTSLRQIFAKYEKPFSTNLIDVVQLALSIIEPSANGYSETRELSRAVNHLRVNSSVNVRIIQGDQPSIKVVANSKRNASKMITKVSGDTLVIDQEPTVTISQDGSAKTVVHGRVGRVFTNFSGTMNINMRGDGIAINGSNVLDSEYIEITVRQIASVEMRGSSDVSYKDFSQKDLSLSINGSGDAFLSGTVEKLDIRVSGSGDVRAKELVAKHASLMVSGSGSIKANVTTEADAVVSGSGEIKVVGNPSKKSERVSGSGSIKFK